MKKVLLVLSIVLVLTFAMASVAYATGAVPVPSPAATSSVSQVITDGFNEVKTQTKNIVFDVVLWILRAIVIVFLIARIVIAAVARRRGEGIEFTSIIAAGVVLVLLFVLPEALWNLVG